MRRVSGGFTLVELMVVIAILGVLVSVLTVAIMEIWGEAGSQTDAMQLTKFRGQLDLAVVSDKRSIKMLAPKDGKGSFADLVQALYDSKVLSHSDIASLGGGDSSITDTVLRSKDLGPGGYLDFTGPNTGETLVDLLRGGTEDGVLFCSNADNYKEYLDEGMIVMFAGREQAQVLMPVQIKSEYESATDKQVDFGGELSDLSDNFYGKPPFQHVVPK